MGDKTSKYLQATNQTVFGPDLSGSVAREFESRGGLALRDRQTLISAVAP